MTPGQIIALVRDALIVGALAFLIWRIYHDGENAVKVRDIQAVQKQLAQQTQDQARYVQQVQHAQDQQKLDMDTVTAAIASQRTPVFVQPAPAATCPARLSGSSTQAASPPAGRGGSDARPQRDIRPELNAFALKYETALTDCRAALAQWPH